MAGLEYRYGIPVASPWPGLAVIVLPVINVMYRQRMLANWQLIMAGALCLLLVFLLLRRFPRRLKPSLTLSANGISSSQPTQTWNWSDIHQLEFAAHSARHPRHNRILRIHLHSGWQGWHASLASHGSPIGANTRRPQPCGSHRRMAVCQGPFGLKALRYDQLP